MLRGGLVKERVASVGALKLKLAPFYMRSLYSCGGLQSAERGFHAVSAATTFAKAFSHRAEGLLKPQPIKFDLVSSCLCARKLKAVAATPQVRFTRSNLIWYNVLKRSSFERPGA